MKLLAALLALTATGAQDFPGRAFLDDIHVIRNYRPGKNSFVEATDRHAGHWTHKGFRYTLLNVNGAGSLRHVWSTWFPDGPYFEWQFFIDGEKEPSIRGPLEKLVQTGEKDDRSRPRRRSSRSTPPSAITTFTCPCRSPPASASTSCSNRRRWGYSLPNSTTGLRTKAWRACDCAWRR